MSVVVVVIVVVVNVVGKDHSVTLFVHVRWLASSGQQVSFVVPATLGRPHVSVTDWTTYVRLLLRSEGRPSDRSTWHF